MVATIARRVIAVFVSAALVTVQTAAVAQDAAGPDRMNDFGEQGQAFGQASRPDPKSLFGSDGQGQTLLFPGSPAPEAIDPTSLFGGADESTEVPALVDLWGNNEAALSEGSARLDALATEQSPEGEAYRVLLDSKDAVGLNVTNDPIVTSSDQILAAIDKLKEEFGDCTDTSTFTAGEASVHVPDLRYCERLILPSSSCDINHEISLSQTRSVGTVSVNPRSDVTLDLDLKNGRATWSDYIGQHDVAISPLDYDLVCPAGASSSSELVLDVTRNDRTLMWLWIQQSTTTVFPRQSSVISQENPSCANDLKAKITVSEGDAEPVRTGKESYTFKWYPVDYSWNLEIAAVTSDEWKPPGCIDQAKAQTVGICTKKLVVTEGPQDPAGCWAIDGRYICPGSAQYAAISPPPFDPEETIVSRLATGVHLESECKLTPGTVCVEDVHGETTCDPTVDPITNTCDELINNPACRYITTSAVIDATDPEGATYAFEDQYDCGHDVSTPTTVRHVALSCPASIRGLGTEFVTPNYETNDSFAKVAGTLQAANLMAMDTDCTTDAETGVTDCKVFKGDPRTCKKAMGGIVNCCESPAGVSLQQYMQLVFAVRDVDSAVMSLDEGSAIRGAWETMTGVVDEAWSTISEPITSAFNTVSGSTAATAGDAAAQGLLTTIEQELIHTVAEWTNSLFGEAATNLLFSTAAEGGASGGGAAVLADGSVATGSLQLGGGAAALGSALSVVMAAYAIYQVTMVLIKMAYKCGMTEYETAAKRELKSCHYVGTFCDQKVLGFCTVRKQSFCCFASPISRILQEQMRPQLGMSWGPAKAPNCEGLAIADFDRVDWAKVDLSEWMGILIETDTLPDAAQMTPEQLTGMARDLAAGNPAEPRMSTPERTIERLKGLELENWMNQAKDELMLSTPSAPGP